MSVPLYVPVLPVRQHARLAYLDVRPDLHAAMAPLWNLPPCPGVPPGELSGAPWRKELDRVRGAHRRHPGWVDAPFAEEAQIPALSEILSECTALSGLLRPVTGPERSAAQRSAALEAARRHGCGVGVRVRVPGEWNGGTAEDVDRLLAHAEPDVPVDLLLDLGAVLPGRPDAAKEALRALDALWPLADWRTAAVLGGGFPQVTNEVPQLGVLHEEPRTDWQVWQETRAGDRGYAPLLAYGDYGVRPVTALAQQPAGGSPPWGVLRYTIDSWFVLCKVWNRGPDRAAGIRAAALRIREMPEFRGAVASAGETWLRDCAEGPATSKVGTGQAPHWLRAGYIQHMTYVVRSLRRL
ncbi:beta family protein [Streptomyces marincola]|uniref:beta family protein n=1 Tax=Streptomyces marincola TaxID=2878388 RepID=UPI001CF213F0|nr:beta family protein [Streptomyces marincola]UCM86967.1 beta family protein [Streptomyces marincola]